MYKVRFNLGRGKNYRTWQIALPSKEKIHFESKEVVLELKNPKLANSKKIAKKIFEGANKSVCSYIICEDVVIHKVGTIGFDDIKQATEVRYNPRENPFWVENGEDVDGKQYKALFTLDRKVYNLGG